MYIGGNESNIRSRGTYFCGLPAEYPEPSFSDSKIKKKKKMDRRGQAGQRHVRRSNDMVFLVLSGNNYFVFNYFSSDTCCPGIS
jgi:hypothetical protein